MHLWSSQEIKKTKIKSPLAKLRAKQEVLAHLKMKLVGSSVLGEADEAAGLESTEEQQPGASKQDRG